MLTMLTMRRRRTMPWMSTAVGAVLGAVLLHPVTTAIYWFEVHPEASGWRTIWAFVNYRMQAGFSVAMLAMMGVFAFIGGAHGLAYGIVSATLAERRRTVDALELELGRAIPALLVAGESELLEYKSSARWDYREGKTSGTIEDATARAIAGLLNDRGGNLLIGVDDSGAALGLEKDDASLRRKDRDGYQQFLMTLLQRRLGAKACRLVHVMFHTIDGREVCRVLVEPAPSPVYFATERGAEYYVRTGNGTRALDVREAIEHTAARVG